jgi:hypothetical protein
LLNTWNGMEVTSSNLEGGRVCIPMYTLVVKSLCGGGPLSHKKGVSYTNLMSSLVVTLKIYYYYYI